MLVSVAGRNDMKTATLMGLVGLFLYGLQADAQVVTFTNKEGRVWTGINLKVIQTAANQNNDPGALYVMGEYYLSLKNPTNFFAATNCFRRAISKGSGQAAWGMVQIFEQGANYTNEEMTKFRKLAADSGVYKAICWMADNDVTNKDAWMEKAAKAGNRTAAANIALKSTGKERFKRLLELGAFGSLAWDEWGSSGDPVKAMKWAFVAKKLNTCEFVKKDLFTMNYKQKLSLLKPEEAMRAERDADEFIERWKKAEPTHQMRSP